MPYNKRTGVTTLIKVVGHLCGLYDVFSPKLIVWVNASSLDSSQKLVVTNWLGAASTVCALIKLIPDD